MRRDHPSGRPRIRPQIKKRYSLLRIPEDGPLNPRMRERVEDSKIEAIGFIHAEHNQSEDD